MPPAFDYIGQIQDQCVSIRKSLKEISDSVDHLVVLVQTTTPFPQQPPSPSQLPVSFDPVAILTHIETICVNFDVCADNIEVLEGDSISLIQTLKQPTTMIPSSDNGFSSIFGYRTSMLSQSTVGEINLVKAGLNGIIRYYDQVDVRIQSQLPQIERYCMELIHTQKYTQCLGGNSQKPQTSIITTPSTTVGPVKFLTPREDRFVTETTNEISKKSYDDGDDEKDSTRIKNNSKNNNQQLEQHSPLTDISNHNDNEPKHLLIKPDMNSILTFPSFTDTIQQQQQQNVIDDDGSDYSQFGIGSEDLGSLHQRGVGHRNDINNNNKNRNKNDKNNTALNSIDRAISRTRANEKINTNNTKDFPQSDPLKKKSFTSTIVQQQIIDSMQRSRDSLGDNLAKTQSSYDSLLMSSEVLTLINQDASTAKDNSQLSVDLTKKHERKALLEKFMVRWSFLFFCTIAGWIILRRALWFATPVVYAGKGVYGTVGLIKSIILWFVSFMTKLD